MTDMTKDEALRLAPHYVEILCALRDGTILNQRACEQIAECLEALSRPATAPGSAEVEIMHPGYKKPYPAWTVLEDLAAQEGCDGEPYDQMIEAADLIRRQAEELKELKAVVAASSSQLERLAFSIPGFAPHRAEFVMLSQAMARALLNKETGNDTR